MRSDSGIQISDREFYRLDSLFRFGYTLPGVAPFFGYFKDGDNPALLNIEAILQCLNQVLTPFFMQLMG